MMPKGVEHYAAIYGQCQQRHVKIPMMPKGVEHSAEEAQVAKEFNVKIPMMPKGVEHLPIWQLSLL